MHRQAWIMHELPYASSLRPPDQRNNLDQWTLPLISKDGSGTRYEFKTDDPKQVLYLLGQASSPSSPSSPIRAPNTMIAHANPTKAFCGWFTKCVQGPTDDPTPNPPTTSDRKSVRKWQLDRASQNVPPAPHLINLSSIVQTIFKWEVDESPEYNCGGGSK